jgi:hypothetical protein
MSIDTHILLRSPLSAADVRAALVRDPALADLALVDHGEWVGMGNDRVSLNVDPWDEDDHDLIEGGFETATVTVTLGLARGKAGWDAYHRTFAAVLHLVPGDACAQEQGGGALGLLRLDGVVYVNPNWISPEDLTDFGYHPERIVVGIPSQTAEVAAK